MGRDDERVPYHCCALLAIHGWIPAEVGRGTLFHILRASGARAECLVQKDLRKKSEGNEKGIGPIRYPSQPGINPAEPDTQELP